MKLLVVLALFFGAITCLADDEGAVAGPSIQGEISRLESKRWSGKLTSEEKLRLGEIYFLTSRCDDVKTLFAKKDKQPVAGELLLCACGGSCVKGSDEGQVHQFRNMLEKGASWRDARVQKLWRKLKTSPEARYWAVKALRQDRAGSRVQTVRADLEKSLESLEVHP